MEANNNYLQLIQDIKLRISHSRYIAARLVNQGQLMLYLSVGALIDTKIQEQQWGTNVISQIALDLKRNCLSCGDFLTVIFATCASFTRLIVWRKFGSYELPNYKLLIM